MYGPNQAVSNQQYAVSPPPERATIHSTLDTVDKMLDAALGKLHSVTARAITPEPMADAALAPQPQSMSVTEKAGQLHARACQLLSLIERLEVAIG